MVAVDMIGILNLLSACILPLSRQDGKHLIEFETFASLRLSGRRIHYKVAKNPGTIG
jgi:hypothetical protein